jgi:2-polyprenyl-3-methyl-5-hydroxy-6-metoxy-1,4-benzoquinol methylase
VAGLLVPARRRGYEVLDQDDVDPVVVVRSHRDIARANALFGGTRCILARLRELVPRLPAAPVIVDVGAGGGDVLDAACALLRQSGRRPRGIAVDTAQVLAPAVRARGLEFVAGDARALPLADRSADVVLAAQLVHHFPDDELDPLVRELDRVARVAVLVGDIRRSWLAAAGLWLASWPLDFHPASRHDGVTSVLRGFRPAELTALVRRATGATADVRRHLGWRVTATWTPHAA